MATATVVITSATLVGDQVTATGTVDGTPCTVTCWQSYLNTLPTKAAKVNYIAGLMKAQIYPPSTSVDLSATVTI